MRNPTIRSQLEKGETLAFEDTDLYKQVFALADKAAGKPLPRAILPGIVLESPKITRKLTTACVPPVTPTSPAEADLDPDAMDDEDFREEQQREEDKQQRPVDWDEPPSKDVPPHRWPVRAGYTSGRSVVVRFPQGPPGFLPQRNPVRNRHSLQPHQRLSVCPVVSGDRIRLVDGQSQPGVGQVVHVGGAAFSHVAGPDQLDARLAGHSCSVRDHRPLALQAKPVVAQPARDGARL
nr:hypothetical protein [Tanacetum cinerariifolium]